jgi:hypothetical protein
VFDIARTTPNQVAPSHVVEGKVKQVKEKGTVIEDVQDIAKAHSVDLVVGAATVSSLTEAEKSEMTEKSEMNINDLTVDELKKERPDLVDLLKEQDTPPEDSNLVKKVETLTAKLEEAEKAKEAAEQKAEEAKKVQESDEALKAALAETALKEDAQEKGNAWTEDQIKALVESHIKHAEAILGGPLKKDDIDIPNEGKKKEEKKEMSWGEAAARGAGVWQEKKKED